MKLDLNEEEIKDIKTMGFITARAWRKMTTEQILLSLSIAGEELAYRDLSLSEAIGLLEITNYLISVATCRIKQHNQNP